MSNSSRKFKRQFQGVEYVERISYREARKRGAKCLMGILAALVLIVALAFVCVPAHAQATTNTFNVYSFRTSVNPQTVGAMTTAAQGQCNSNNTYPCVIVFDPILSSFPLGNMPTRCTSCTWLDYRTAGSFQFSGISNPFATIFAVDGATYSGCPAAVTAAGTSIGAWVYIPGTGPLIDCGTTISENITIHNLDRTRDWCNAGISTPPCNAVNYNYDDGNVYAIERHEMTTSHQDLNGVSLGLYSITTLMNATANGNSGIDGFSGEANTKGTLSGTFQAVQAHEADVTIASTGGTITDARGGVFYINTNASSTTVVTNATGAYFVGCNFGHLLGVIPGNCFGARFADQRGQAPGRNYSFASDGLGLFNWSNNLGIGGFDCEDNNHVTHRCIYTDNTGGTGSGLSILNIQGVSTSGICFNTSVGGCLVQINSASGIQIAGLMQPTTGTQDIARTGNPFQNIYIKGAVLEAAAPTVAAAQVGFGSTTATTVGAAGAAAALPATPTGYLIINVAGTAQKMPYYN